MVTTLARSPARYYVGRSWRPRMAHLVATSTLLAASISIAALALATVTTTGAGAGPCRVPHLGPRGQPGQGSLSKASGCRRPTSPLAPTAWSCSLRPRGSTPARRSLSST